MTGGANSPPRWPRWALFAAFVLVVPVPYFMVVAVGLVPLSCILFISVQGLVVALPKFSAEAFVMLGIMWGHVLLLGGLLYVIASGITRLLLRLLPRRYAVLAVTALIAALLVASTFDIYRLPRHQGGIPADIFRVLKDCAT